MPTTLPLRHVLLALAVVAVWGTNFVVIKIALEHLPPLLLATLRFTFAAFPLVFLLPRPPVPLRQLAAYGLLIGAGQFGLLFIAMKADISPGLASLVIQAQVFFTIGLALLLGGERIRPFQLVALAVATAGFAIIGVHADGATTVFGLALVLIAAFCWAAGNIVQRRSGPVNMLAYVVWASLFCIPPLAAASLLLEGWPAIVTGLERADVATWGSVLWQSVGNTMFGYGAWGFLLARYASASVAPMALLVPVFGMTASAWWLDESLPAWKIEAALLVLTGLALNLLWPRLKPWVLAAAR
ncbi:MAG: EamA family transporter [Alphaproteobacteria bacterium]|nr:EamA family transporter [Alphaproteobacteria bacterium]